MLREKNSMNKSARICNHTFPSCLIEQSKVPATSFPTESRIQSILPKKASEDSSVLGTTGLKSPNPALPSDPFRNSVLNPDKQLTFYCWKSLWLPFPCLHPLFLSFGEKQLVREQNSVTRCTALLLFTTLKLK